MSTGAAIFIEGLLRAVPELSAIYEEHLSDNDSLLPHVFMAEVSRFAIREAKAPRSREILRRLLGHLEDGLNSGADDLRDLIGASFVENLIGEDVAVRALKPVMGPKLRQQVDTMCGG